MQDVFDSNNPCTKLIVDEVYQGGRNGNASDDPLVKLLGVSNQGGFRYLRKGKLSIPRGGKPQLLVVITNFSEPDWPDHIDLELGRFTYFGDNRKPGRLLEDTPRFGNKILGRLFDATHTNQRIEVPPILVFANTGTFRDVQFLGLAVPGALDVTQGEDLVAIWKISHGKRFQNYRAIFTILDAASVSLDWINDIKKNDPLSDNCPKSWKSWIENGSYKPMITKQSLEYRTKAEQLPESKTQLKMIEAIHTHFQEQPHGFEAFAAELMRLMDPNFVSYEVTRKTADGGRDAVGNFRIGIGQSGILVDFALEAKCYNYKATSVGVRDVARLISRLRHRQFGVLVTTSYVATQAYKEIKEDGHPVIVISAVDIISILERAEIVSVAQLKHLLKNKFPVDARQA